MKLRTMSLKDQNYEVTEGECPECEDAALWVNTHELVCEECHQVFRDGDQHTVSTDDVDPTEAPAVEFYEHRTGDSEKHRYSHSDKPIMPGGFEDAYEGDGIYGNGRDEDELLDTRRRY